MKKILLLLLSLIVVFSLISCCNDVEYCTVTFVYNEDTIAELTLLKGSTIPSKYLAFLENILIKISGKESIVWKTEDDTVIDLREPIDDSITVIANPTTCIAQGTAITMADGSKKNVEDLIVGDLIRTFDHETGELSYSEVYDIMKSKDVKGAIELSFDDGTVLTIINEHGFYNKEENKYVFINKKNVSSYINCLFYNADSDSFVKLISYKILDTPLDAYSIVSAKHLNHIADGMLSMTDGIMKVICNVFEFDENLKVNQQKKENDINKYGLINIEDLKYYNKEDYEAYNIKYFKIAIGKGYITEEELDYLASVLVNL